MTVTYRRWNDAIRRYLFENGQDKGEVYLYITPDVLDEISNQNPKETLGGHVGFIACVKDMFSHRDLRRGLRLRELWRDMCGIQPSKKFLDNYLSNSVFECGLCFTDPIINAKFRCGYLNILAYALLKLNTCPEGQERAIGNYLNEILVADFGGLENGNYQPISDLFAHLNREYPTFKDISINGYTHVGRLRYQLLLTPSQIAELKDLLYTRCVTTASIDSYETTVNKIHGYATENIKSILDLSMTHPAYRQRIQNVFSAFDFDVYADSLDSKIEPSLKGTLRHALCFDDNGCRPILLTDICNVNISLFDKKKEEICVVAEPNDRIFGLNPNHVMRNGCDRFELDESIEVEDHGIKLTTVYNAGIWLMEECNDGLYYVETKNPVPEKNIFVIVDAAINKSLKSTLNLSAMDVVYDPILKNGPDLIPEVIGKNRYLYQGKGSAAKQNGTRLIRTLRKGKKRDDIYKMGGLLHPRHKNEYFVNSLPEYMFPSGFDTQHISLSISLDSQPFSEFNLIMNNDNRIIIDILNFTSIGTERASRLELSWKSDNKLIYKDTLYVIKADGNYNEEALRKLDIWGQPVKVDSVDVFNAWGGKSSNEPNRVERLSGFNSNLRNLVDFADSDNSDLINLKTQYLINLLATIGLSDEKMMISRPRLKECILMASERNGNHTDGEKQITTVVSKLISFGYLLPIYGGGQTRYQVLPPMFVKSQAPVRLHRKQGGDPYMWILMGCYTRGFLEYLLSNNKEQIITVRDDDSSKLVGSRILLHHTFDPKEFMNDSGYKCIVIEYDLLSAMLSSIPTVDEYISTLKEIPQFGVSLIPADKSTFPRVRESSGYVFRKSRYIEKESGVFFESKVTDPGWMCLAAAKMEGMASVILSDLELLRPIHMRFPSILERILGMLDVRPPKHVRAFVMDSYDDRHALFCDYIQYGLDTGEVVLKQLRRIFGPLGELYSKATLPVRSYLTLYTNRSYFSKAPVYAIVYSLYGQIDLVAYWFGRSMAPEVYISNNGNGFDKVVMSGYGDGAIGINKLLSMLLKDRNSFRSIPALPNSHVSSLPFCLDKYHCTEMRIIEKK